MKFNTIFYRLLVSVVLLIGMPVSVFAVTPDEMEEARTITAKIYLRCANSGSDYLEKVKATTLGELEGQLKVKEKENLATFKSFSVPTDYASWGKDDLVKYWSGTFYANPQVKLESKGFAQKMTEKAIKNMKIQDPGEAPAPAEEADADITLPDPVTNTATDDEATKASLDTIADNLQPAAAEKGSEDSNNTIYIVLLCILVAFVVVLIVYAARMFKRQSDADDEEDDGEAVESKARKADANVNVTIAAQPVADASRNSSKETESLRAENAELRRAIDDYKYHLNYVKSEKAELQEQVRRLQEQLDKAKHSAEVRSDDSYSDAEVDSTVYTDTEERFARPVERSKTLYLGRANDQGMFTRAERELNPSHSVFRLVSTDGITGTFTVIESPAVESRIMADVRQALRGSCECDFSEARGRTGVETYRGGTAIFDQGRWKVLRRAQVRFV